MKIAKDIRWIGGGRAAQVESTPPSVASEISQAVEPWLRSALPPIDSSDQRILLQAGKYDPLVRSCIPYVIHVGRTFFTAFPSMTGDFIAQSLAHIGKSLLRVDPCGGATPTIYACAFVWRVMDDMRAKEIRRRKTFCGSIDDEENTVHPSYDKDPGYEYDCAHVWEWQGGAKKPKPKDRAEPIKVERPFTSYPFDITEPIQLTFLD